MLRLATASPMRNSWKPAVRVATDRLRPAGEQRRVVDLAAVRRGRAQLGGTARRWPPCRGRRRPSRRGARHGGRCGRCRAPHTAVRTRGARRTHALVERDPCVSVSLNALAYGTWFIPPTSMPEHALRRDDLQPGTRAGDHLRRRHRRVGAVVVVEQHVAGRRDVAAEHVPARRPRARASSLELRELGQPAGRDDDDVRVEGEDVGRPRPGRRSGRRPRGATARRRATRRCPMRSLRRGLRAARLIWPPAHGIASSSVTSWPRSPATRAASSPPGPAPTTTTRRRCRRRRDVVGHRRLAAGGRVVDAQRLACLVDAIEAVGRPDARADLGFAPGDDLAHDVRVGEVGAGHARPGRPCPRGWRGGPSPRRRSWRRGAPPATSPPAPGRRSRGAVPTASRGSGSPRSAWRRRRCTRG